MSTNNTNISSKTSSPSHSHSLPQESLLSKASLSLSLAPPRFPPYETAHRSLHHGQNPKNKSLALHHDYYYSHLGRKVNLLDQHPLKKREYQRIHDLLVKIFHMKRGGGVGNTDIDTTHNANKNTQKKQTNSITTTPTHHPTHPHISLSPETSEQISRYISSYILPLKYQNKYRDNGFFRTLSDNSVKCSVPSLAIINPNAAYTFIHLTKNVMKRIKYGLLGHDSQYIDLFLPEGVSEDEMNGLVFFVVSSGISLQQHRVFIYIFLT